MLRFNCRFKLHAWTIVFGIGFFYSGCASEEKKEPKHEVESTPEKESEEKAEKKETSDVNLSSGERQTITVSASNNQQTSHAISKDKAAQMAEKLNGAKDMAKLEALLSAQWLGGYGVANLLETSRKIVVLEMSKEVGKGLSDEVKMEIVAGAIKEKKYAMAEFYLDELMDSKKGKIKAAAYNAVGVIAMKEGRYPEAATAFKEALKVGSYKPAMFNLGFLSLKFGDFKTAKENLGNVADDWYAMSGLLVADRLSGKDDRVDGLCKQVLEKKPNHKPTLINCAVFEYQNKNNFAEAKKLLNKAVTAKGGDDSVLDEKAYRLVSIIEKEEADHSHKLKQRKAEQEAKEKKEDAKDSKEGQHAQSAEGGESQAPAKEDDGKEGAKQGDEQEGKGK